jgi:adenylate cyclase
MTFLRRAAGFDRVIGLLLLVALVALKYSDPYPVQFLRLKVFDFYQQTKPRELPPPEKKPVTIIDIDETSLTKVGQWPWPRTTIAKLVQNTMQMGAAVIAFDIVFAEPDRLSLSSVADTAIGIDDATREKLKNTKSNDEILADVIKRSRVVLGHAGRQSKVEGQEQRPPVKKVVAVLKGKGAIDPLAYLPTFKFVTRNLPVLEEAVKGPFGGIGMFNAIPDRDGIIRNVPAFFVHDGIIYPSLAAEMMRVLTGKKNIVIRANQAGIEKIGIHRGLTVETDEHGRIWPYFSLRDRAKYVSAVEILNGTADPKMLKGKLTIVGTSAVGLLDIRAVPTDPIIPGVEVHAQIVEAAFNQAYLKRPGYYLAAELAFIIVAGLLMVILVPWVGAKWTALLLVAVCGAAGGTSWYMFTVQLHLLDASYPIFTVFLIYSALTYTGYAKEEAQRRQTREAFSKYLSPDMVKRVAENPDELKLGGDKRDMTLLFCDVRGFTTISEQFDAVGLTALINKLLTPLTNVILERHGTIDKYMGDCIMAFWNAPLDDGDHEYNGCTSALAMLAEMGPLNDRLEKEAIEEGRKHVPLKVGLGLNTGSCVVGNMGSEQRFDYSVLGDSVNLASRLEGQSKSYGMNVVLGPSTRDAVKDRLATIELDFIQVKGKTTGVKIYGLMGDETIAADPKFRNIQNKIDQAMTLYRRREWDDARQLFKQVRELGNDENKPWTIDANLDGLCELFEERIVEYKRNPPPIGWDGVFIATSK